MNTRDYYITFTQRNSDVIAVLHFTVTVRSSTTMIITGTLNTRYSSIPKYDTSPTLQLRGTLLPSTNATNGHLYRSGVIWFIIFDSGNFVGPKFKIDHLVSEQLYWSAIETKGYECKLT